MKMFKMLFAIAVCFTMFVGISQAQGFSADNKPTPIFCDNGSNDTVSAAAGAGLLGTAISANPARLDGEIMNLTTDYLLCSFVTTSSTGTTFQAIEADHFIIYPAGDSYGRDRLELKRNDNVYRGAMYFYATWVDLTTKTLGKVSVWEWK